MKRKNYLAFTIAVFVSLFVSVVEAEENPSSDAEVTPVKAQEDSPSFKAVPVPQPDSDRKSEASSLEHLQTRTPSPEKYTNAAEGVSENNGIGQSLKADSVGYRHDRSSDFESIEKAQPDMTASVLPAWIAVAVSLLTLGVVVLLICLLKRGKGWLDDTIGNVHRQLQNDITGLDENVKAIRNVLGESPLEKTLQQQFNKVEKSLQSLERKIGGVDQSAQDFLGKFDKMGESILRDSKERHTSFFSWLFGREKTQAPESGFAQQIKETLEDFQSKILAALETDEKLQFRKLELDERESLLAKREQSLNDECEKARKDGASVAERRADALKDAYNVLGKTLSEKTAEFEKVIKENSIEFGKSVKSLESERDEAMTAAKNAKEASAEAIRRAEKAMKDRGILEDKVSHLSSEIAKRDQSWNTELAKKRDEIRNEIEHACDEKMAELRAKLELAREECEKAIKSIEKIRAEKASVDAALDDTKKSLENEKMARENEHETAAQELEAEKKARQSERENAEQRLAIVSTERDTAKSRLFPAEFRGDPSFEPLLARLDALDVAGAPGATLARASLAIFAERKNLSAKIWQRALGDLSLGLAIAMDSDKMHPADVVATLGAWKSAIEKHVTGGPSFSLNLPSIGSKVEFSWMHAKSGAATVRRVLSWAVYGQSGNAYMAEVE